MINDGEFEYAYGANRVPVAQVSLETNEVQYLHSDFIGSVIAVTDDSSNIESILNYGAYGKRIGANVTRFGFAGEWVDTDTGYSYNRARWYDSSTAHFLSKDPLVQSTREAYGYAGGNPLTRIDPSGAIWCHEENDFNFWTSSCFSFMDTQAAENVTNFSAGFGDNASLGATDAIRDAMGTNNVIDNCSKSYVAGDVTAEVVTSIDPKKQVTKASMKQIAAPKVMKAIEAPKAKNPVGEYFAKAGPGNKTMQDAKDEFHNDKKSFNEYITNTGVFANGKFPVKNTNGSTSIPPKEMDAFNKIGDKDGCHHCGTKIPGTKSGVNWVKDHMPPKALNRNPPMPQDFYPQCKGCMGFQGGAVRSIQSYK